MCNLKYIVLASHFGQVWVYIYVCMYVCMCIHTRIQKNNPKTNYYKFISSVYIDKLSRSWVRVVEAATNVCIRIGRLRHTCRSGLPQTLFKRDVVTTRLNSFYIQVSRTNSPGKETGNKRWMPPKGQQTWLKQM